MGDDDRQSNGRNGATSSPSNTRQREKMQQSRLPPWKRLIRDFSPIWFAVVMNTGILAILMHLLPYQFHGLPVLSTIMYVFELVLFVIFSIVTILRWILFREETMKATGNDLEQLSFLAAPAIAFLTLTGLTGLIVSNAYWGHHAWTMVSYVMWWIGTAWMGTTGIAVPIYLFRTQLISNEQAISPAMVLPVVGMATDGAIGATLCNYAYDLSPRLAVPVLVLSFMLGGFALWFAILMYSSIFHRFLIVGYPAPAKMPASFIMIGPFGIIASLMLAVASAVQTKMDFAGYNRGTFLTAMAAPGVSSASIVFALLLIGHDVFWLVCALVGTIETVIKGQSSYSMSWWATIFPIGTLALSLLELSIAMDSPTFRVLATALLLILLVDYFVNWGYTIWYSIYGELLISRDTKNVATDEEDKES